MEHLRTKLTPTIVINKLITMFYFEFGKGYVFRGEKHNFWEFLYVDKGEIEVVADTDRYWLKQGSIIFHKPNEFHSFYARQGTAPSVIVMTFDCHSRAMKRFENQVIALNDEERNMLANVVKEGMNAFEFPFKYPIYRRKDAPIGSEQLLQCYLTAFLIRLLRKNEFQPFKTALGASELGLADGDWGKERVGVRELELSTAVKEKSGAQLASLVTRYMTERLDQNLTLDEISEALHIAKTRLKEAFKKETGQTIMDTFARMKIQRAKELIREDNSNFTEIARTLGYSSLHYFSKTFKRATGSNPSEYARTVKARVMASRVKAGS
ncbi:AraC family transcriptional regulator [Paenibacillus koleovorans]|uniref:AraC family transcriptional regulator n=1 Tax=Paenibacillus koleovorans TaxID=121608 RepID=UPI000FDCBFEC|nr:AraC family transcriptional regulator [Paenibacillus koleovorans]